MTNRPYFLRNRSDVAIRTRGYIPHWELDGATYSITFRLCDSIPRDVIAEIYDAKQTLERGLAYGTRTLADWKEIEQRLDAALDRHEGSASMRDKRVAEIVARTLTYFDEDRYNLYAWCVMPNHVHAVVQPAGVWSLARILHSWKSYSSKEANTALRREGRFWQREYFDRIIRDDEDLEQTVAYVLANPLKSGLEDWPFVSAGRRPADRPAGRRRSVL